MTSSSKSPRSKSALLLMALAILLPTIMLLSIGTGPVAISPMEILLILANKVGLTSSEVAIQTQLIVESIRIPRTLLGAIIGSSLAVSGAAMQGLFRNPLADPGIIGVSSGAALGAGVGIVLGSIIFYEQTSPLLVNYGVSLLAFVGGVLTTWIVYKVGTTSNGTSVATMLLAGVAIGALTGAGLGILTYIADDTTLRSLTFWQMGSLGGANWNSVILAFSILGPVTFFLCRYGQVLNAMLLGESEARHLGINVQSTKLKLILVTALAVGVSVSVAGIIGFVGLVVPHLIRLMVGPDHRTLLPASAMLGAVLLLTADMISRTIVAPAELPIGIVTSLMGAPFFMSLLWQQRKRIA
ncbi:iron ABC transporter [Endozoicomonas sp. OPT23]|uniref:FecCD family ABC transporter permease n=1 Tax=Endozoicomonas sp. OPT23 TaxID=2072845 RepID=UPI00129B8E33|nr:iron chelate uptake ABC transporter family permease subunit [Endozoicomonas sp. OPT23]MRI33089.1 iron ABC transporter [Endozoicomonas sp. OPT23]